MSLTDYLERLLEGADALAEQVKRLERQLSGLPREGTGEPETGVSLPDSEDLVESGPQGKGASLLGHWTGETEGAEPERRRGTQGSGSRGPSQEEALEAPERIPTPLERQKGGILAQQLEQLEQAVRSAARLPAAGWEQGGEGLREMGTGFFSLPRPGMGFFPGSELAAEGRTAGAGLGGRVLQAAGELVRAEETDRVFRRDSRRYDGGFYLY